MAKHIITSTDQWGNRSFYAGSGRWSNERPDAYEWDNSVAPRQLRAIYQHEYPANLTWPRAKVETEE